jgi:hypothetical protein
MEAETAMMKRVSTLPELKDRQVFKSTQSVSFFVGEWNIALYSETEN